MLKNLTIKSKLLASFGFIIVFVLVVSAYMNYGASNVSAGFSKYRHMTNNVVLSSNIQSSMLMVRMKAKDYIVSHSKKDIAGFNKYYNQTDKLVQYALKNVKTPSRNKLVQELSKDLIEYKKSFNKVVKLIQKRDDIVNNNLNVNGHKIEQLLTIILRNTENNKDKPYLINIAEAERSLILSRLHTNKFLSSSSEEEAVEVDKEFTILADNLMELQYGLFDTDSTEKLEQVIELIEKYKTGVKDIVTTIKTRDNIIKNSLEKIGLNIEKIAENIKDSIRKGQDKIGVQVESLNDNFKSISIVMLVISLLLILVSMFLSNSIVKPLRRLISTISSSTSEIQTASSNLSSGAINLSNMSANQSASVEEITATIEETSHNTNSSFESMERLKELGSDVNVSAKTGYDYMTKLSSSMNEISNSSQEINSLVNTIDEIAFQTNLLALNAAVEAARAGEHGLGFAVVSEEVRNLATRSSQESQKIHEVIEKAVEQTQNGTKIADITNESFKDIVVKIEDTMSLIDSNIISSKEQKDSIEQLRNEMMKVDEVTKNLSLSSEQVSTQVEQLNLQSISTNNVVLDISKMI
jgi:methyl-accepting chemotaxis protein